MPDIYGRPTAEDAYLRGAQAGFQPGLDLHPLVPDRVPALLRPESVEAAVTSLGQARETQVRLRDALVAAEAAVTAAKAKDADAIAQWVEDGATGKPPADTAAKAERELQLAKQRHDQAASLVRRRSEAAKAVILENREAWHAAIREHVAELRAEAVEAAKAAQEKLNTLYDAGKAAQYVAWLDPERPDTATTARDLAVPNVVAPATRLIEWPDPTGKNQPVDLDTLLDVVGPNRTHSVADLHPDENGLWTVQKSDGIGNLVKPDSGHWRDRYSAAKAVKAV